MKRLLNLCCAISFALAVGAQVPYVSQVWNPDLGNGMYKNPVINADYSDPDVIAVGNDYYLTASSFESMPGLPILHSTDLVNWEIVGHALREPYNVPGERLGHGNGVWAPSIRFHQGEFYIYWGDPDMGVFMVKTKDPRGEWEKPVCVIPGKGMIDTTPLWDDDGRCYLVNGWANSRAGFASVLTVRELNAEGTKAIGDPVIVLTATEPRTALVRDRSSTSVRAGIGLCARPEACLRAFSWPCGRRALTVHTRSRRCLNKEAQLSMALIKEDGCTRLKVKTGSCTFKTKGLMVGLYICSR